MKKKVALITGVKGNLGSAVVSYFLQQGWQVVGSVRKKSEISNDNPNYVEITTDLLNETECEHFVEESIRLFGRIDTVVLTAGGFEMGTVENTTSKEINRMYQTNFYTAFNVVRPSIKQMKEQGGGTVFFIGSLPGMDTTKAQNTVAYSLSKSLLFNLANIINIKQVETGVKSYVVVPSTIDTPQNRHAVPNADFSKWQQPRAIAKMIGNYAQKSDSKKSTLIVEEEII